MKQRAPSPEPQSSSKGLRVVIGQNSWNKVEFGDDFWAAVSESGADLCWLSESVCGAESDGAAELDCSADLGRAEVATSGFFSLAFRGLGVSRGPRTFRWEFQNSTQQKKNFLVILISSSSPKFTVILMRTVIYFE